MPKMNKQLNLEITPQQFVFACDDTELKELSLELEREWQRREKLRGPEHLVIDVDADF